MLEVPNHTQIPNIIIDQHMSELSHAQFKVLMAICRKTIGWHKQSDYISISQIVELTGVSNKTVVGAIKQLEKKGFIVTQKAKHATTLITINYEVSSVVSTQGSVMVTPPSVVSTPLSSVMSTHQTILNMELLQKAINMNTHSMNREFTIITVHIMELTTKVWSVQLL